MDEVINSDLRSTTKLVLLILSTHMNNDGNNCWPSFRLIAKKCTLSRDTVIKHISEAIEKGWLRKKERYRDNGDQTSNQYFPLIPAGSSPPLLPSRTGTLQRPILSSQAVLEYYSNNSINNSINKIHIDENLSAEEHREKMRKIVGSK